VLVVSENPKRLADLYRGVVGTAVQSGRRLPSAAGTKKPVRRERAQAEGLECHRLPARVGTRDGEAAPLGRHAQIDRHHRPAGVEEQRVAGRGERHVRRAERGPRAAVPGGELGVGVLVEPAAGM